MGEDHEEEDTSTRRTKMFRAAAPRLRMRIRILCGGAFVASMHRAAAPRLRGGLEWLSFGSEGVSSGDSWVVTSPFHVPPRFSQVVCCTRMPYVRTQPFSLAGLPFQAMAMRTSSASAGPWLTMESGWCWANAQSLPPILGGDETSELLTSGDVDEADDETNETCFEHQEDEDGAWESRVRRRTECIEKAKRGHVYQEVSARADAPRRPKTPDPHQRISKRAWERLAGQWRLSVKVERGPMYVDLSVLHEGVFLVEALEAFALNEPLLVREPWCRHWGNPKGGHQCVGGRSLLLEVKMTEWIEDL